MNASVAPPTLVELATVVGAIVAAEERLFVVLGEAARGEDPPAPPAVLATWCHRHAWHAAMWRDRLPVVAAWFGPDPVLPQVSRAEPGEIHGSTDALGTLAAVVEELDRKLEVLEARIDDRLDGPTARLVTLTRRDLADELAALRHL